VERFLLSPDPPRPLRRAPFLLPFCLALACGGQEGPPRPPGDEAAEFAALSRRLEAEDWAPPYFAGRVPIFQREQEERLLREMAEEPFTLVQAGHYAYRTSPRRVEVGRRLFHLYDWGTADHWRPSQRFAFHALGLSSAEEVRARYGILIDPRDGLVGLVGRPAPGGRIDYGWSCALCHAGAGPGGEIVSGAPNHRYDLGAFHHRALVAHRPRSPLTQGLLDRDTPVEDLAGLGPGRLDMNGDRARNPVKIPSLWGLRETRTGMFANGSVGNIWMGIAHNGGLFPASELLEALVAYVLSLEPPPNPRRGGGAEARGERIFQSSGCASCHAGPYYTSGETVAIEAIGTDPARASVEFPKGYRVPTLRRLDLLGLFLHDGSIASLPDLFRRERLDRVPGHEYGLDLTDEEKDDLVAFLLCL
jgi:hypothetical protein